MWGGGLFLLVIVILGYVMPKNIVINFLQCLVVCVLFAGSQDPMDFYVYEGIYDTARQGFEVDYEVGYVWLNAVCGQLGLTYVEFRCVVGGLFCLLLATLIRKLTVCPNVVWSSYIIFSALFDACILRNSLAMACGMWAIFYLLRARTIMQYGKAIVWIVGAALFHSAYWVLLAFIPLWILCQKKGYVWCVVCIAVAYVFCVMNEQTLFQLYEHLLIREDTIEKYMTGQYSNLVGTAYNFVKYLFLIFPAIYYSRSAVCGICGRSDGDILKHKILLLNIVFGVVLIPQFFAVNFNRVFRMLILFNYIFIACQIGNARGKIYPKAFSFVYASVLLCLFMFWEAQSTLYDVFLMHFKTNVLLSLF